MRLQESGEMYLETILILSQRKENVRAIDICEEMGYSKPSVSRGLKILRENRLPVLPRSKPLRFRHSGSPQRCRLSVGPAFCALPRSEQLR